MKKAEKDERKIRGKQKEVKGRIYSTRCLLICWQFKVKATTETPLFRTIIRCINCLKSKAQRLITDTEQIIMVSDGALFFPEAYIVK